ncbi:MAG TPA: hypothetical protein VEA58_13200 [Anaerovoracaceae bacterium]|nr:hypothetical protein [Anaerovoracaceae bacterium]
MKIHNVKGLPFYPKLAFLPQLQLQWQNGQWHDMRAGGEAVAWLGKTDSSTSEACAGVPERNVVIF